MEFPQTLFDYVQFAFDNEKELLEEFLDDGKPPYCRLDSSIEECDIALDEFFMSGSTCLIVVTYLDYTDSFSEYRLRVRTFKYLDWVYKVNGGLLHE